jgi:hypothetical protein
VGVGVGIGDGVVVGVGRGVIVAVGEGVIVGVAVARESSFAGILASAHPVRPSTIPIHRTATNPLTAKVERIL